MLLEDHIKRREGIEVEVAPPSTSMLTYRSWMIRPRIVSPELFIPRTIHPTDCSSHIRKNMLTNCLLEDGLMK